jgi:hypothetical protein
LGDLVRLQPRELRRARSRLLSWLFILIALCPAVAQTAGPSSAGQAPSAEDNAQQSQSQPQSDLSDAARLAREERERQRAKRSTGSQAVDEMATELAEGDEHNAAAPVGYRYYSFKAGDYSILVPADAEVEGRNSYGLKLLSSEAMGSRTIIILGDPIPVTGGTPDEILPSAALRYFGGCRMGIDSAGRPVNGRPAAVAQTFSMCPLHNEVLGFVQFVLGDGYVMPVVCGYPFTADDLDPNPNRPVATIIKKYNREENGYRACDTILPSLRFREHGSQLPPPSVTAAPKKAVVTNALLNSSSGQGLEPAGESSLANVARLHKKVSSTTVLTELEHAAPGFTAYKFRYCAKDDCYNASLQLPVKAHQDEQFQVAYTGLFAFEVPVGDTVAVIQATKGAPTKPGIISRDEFIHTKVDWWIENVPAVAFQGAGNAEVFFEELTTLSDMPARLATFRSPATLQPVMTQLAAYMAPGVFVQIRCSVPEKVYADAKDMCEHVVRSMDVPEAKTQDSDDPPSNDDP